MRSTKPDTLINSRLLYHGNEVEGLELAALDEWVDVGVDFLSYRDRTIPESSPWEFWETCMTLNHSWGYRENDDQWKEAIDVIRQLVEVVSKGALASVLSALWDRLPAFKGSPFFCRRID